MKWSSFVFGLIMGFLLATSILFLTNLGKRYDFAVAGEDGIVVYKFDTWTGKAWIKNILNRSDWEEVKEGYLYGWN